MMVPGPVSMSFCQSLHDMTIAAVCFCLMLKIMGKRFI